MTGLLWKEPKRWTKERAKTGTHQERANEQSNPVRYTMASFVLCRTVFRIRLI